MISQLAILKGKIFEAKNYLRATDYIITKLSEAVANGEDTSELKIKYAEQLAKRKEYRASIDENEALLKPLEEEAKAKLIEERNNLAEARKQEELRQKEAYDLLIKAKKEELEQIEKDRLKQETEQTEELKASVENIK